MRCTYSSMSDGRS
uniref:Uncharacterized protein n=1 Tax=Macrostomum lignano TaxID=282301 RepID=A0A1I8HNG3_9PLAT